MSKKRAKTTVIDEHCENLGYGKVESKNEYKRLLQDLHTHFIAYEKRGNYLGSRDTLSDDAVWCATDFLEEQSRGETLWPENDQGRPVWPRDQPFITDAIAHIIRRKGISSYTKRHSTPRVKVEGQISAKSKRAAKSRKKRRREESDDDELGFAENLEDLTETTVKPWNEPPKRPDPRFCCQYIQTLNPKVDVKRLTDFTTEWLSKKNSPWPESADVKLQTFMHNRNFYVHYDSGEDPPRELINILRKGSELENLENGLLLVEFQRRVRDRVELLTHRLAKEPYLLLEFRRDGAAQMTKPFANKWRIKEDLWELDYVGHIPAQIAPAAESQVNKRRKSKATKSPLVFPNLRTPPVAMPAKSNLTSIAGKALQMMSNELEDGDMSDENISSLDEQDSIVVSDALGITTMRLDDNQSRSVSPDRSIFASREAERSPSTCSNPSLVREQSWFALPTNTNSKDMVGVTKNFLPAARSQAAEAFSTPLSDSSALRTSFFQKLTDLTRNHVRPGSTNRSAWVLEDSRDYGHLANCMVIDGPENIRNLQIEPISDAVQPVSTTINHQPELHSHSPPPLSEESAPTSSIQSHQGEEAPASSQLISSLLIDRPRFAPSPRLSDNPALHLGDNEQPPDSSVPPVLSSLSGTKATTEPTIESPRPPTTPPLSSPPSPARAFDMFLPHYVNRGSAPEILTPTKNTQPFDCRETTMSPKERIRAEKRAVVCAEAAEWHEIRSLEKKSKSRTDSPQQPSTDAQEEMPPPPPPMKISLPIPPSPAPPSLATEPVRTGSTSIILGDNKSSTEDSMSNDSSSFTSHHYTTPPVPVRQIMSPLEELQTAPANVHSTISDAVPVLPSFIERPRSLCTSPEAVSAHNRIPAAQNTQAFRKQTRRPSLGHNLTEPLTPAVSKMRASTPAQASNAKNCLSPYAAPSTIRTEPRANAPRMTSFKPNTIASVEQATNMSPPPVAETQEAPMDIFLSETSTASGIPEPASEKLSIPPSTNHRAVSPTPSKSREELEPVPVLPVCRSQQGEPTPAHPVRTPSVPVIPKPSMSSPTPASNSGRSEISVGVAAAIARPSAAQADTLLKKGGGDNPLTEDRMSEQEVFTRESSEAVKDVPPPRSGAYAHVPEPVPFSATPSEEEIAAMKALQQSQSTKLLPKYYNNQERSIVKSNLHKSGVKTLEVLIESASGEMNLENGFSFDVVMNNTLSGFFSFYAAVSEAPLESFQQLIFTPTWPNCSTTRATKQMGEPGFKRLKKVIQAWYKQAQKADPEEMEFQIMVQMG